MPVLLCLLVKRAFYAFYFDSSGYKSVPGCNGDGRENVDYCIKEDDDDDDDDDKLDRCEGDCDRDEDCSGDLVCFQR